LSEENRLLAGRESRWPGGISHAGIFRSFKTSLDIIRLAAMVHIRCCRARPERILDPRADSDLIERGRPLSFLIV
jgi:hypothetical protein